jgi:hypothetical protein
MKLTKVDIARLRNLQLARERRPTPMRGLWRVKWLILILAFLAIVAFLIPVRPSYKCLVLGFVAGGLYCLCVWAFLIPRFWPLTREVLNWDRIEQLLEEHDGSA